MANQSVQREVRYVVRAVSAYQLEAWLSPLNSAGHRIFGPREKAEVFPTQTAAHTAIGAMPRAFGDAGFFFRVDPAE